LYQDLVCIIFDFSLPDSQAREKSLLWGAMKFVVYTCIFCLILTAGGLKAIGSGWGDTLTIDRKLNRAESLIEQKRLDSAKNLLWAILETGTGGTTQQQIQTYNLLSESYESESLLDSALYYTRKAWRTEQKLDPQQADRQYLIEIAYLNWQKGSYSEALSHAQEAKRYFTRHPDTSSRMNVNNVTGLIFRDLGNYQRAENHFHKALRLASEIGQEHYKGIIWANLASLYQKMDRYSRAISYYEKGSSIELKFQDYQAAGRSFAIIGALYTELREYNKALTNLKKARHYNEKAGDMTGLCRTRNALGNYYNKRQDYPKARQYLLEAEKMARKQGAKKQLMKSYQGLYNNYQHTGQYQQAFQYQSRYLEIYKQLYNVNEIVKLENLQHKLNMQRTKNQNQREQLEKQQTINQLLMALAILSALITALFILLFIRIRKSQKSLRQKNKEINDQKEQLEKLNHNLRTAKKEAEKSEELKDQFLRNISHEIRTPLNGILGFSSIIAESDLKKEQKTEYQHFIKKNANLLLSTINDILDIARIRTKQVEVNKESFDVYRLLEEIKKMFYFDESYYQGKDVHILLEHEAFHRQSNMKVFSDAEKIRRIMAILMDNALKFTQQGFVKIGAQPEGQQVTFFVEDTGIGISREDQEMIYECFTQAEHELSREFDGLGAGLSIAKSFVELLRGKIWFRSQPHQGTTFYFSIPANI